MNYLRELNAFVDWLETNPLGPITQLLWFHLMAVNNKCGWREWFAVANLTLQAKLGVDKKTVIKHRNILIGKGRVEYIQDGSREAGRYRMISITNENGGSYGGKFPPILPSKLPPLDKLNETKLNDRNIYGEFVFLSPEEHARLVERFGEREAGEWIERLNSFAHQKPKRFAGYASHYHTILNWARREEGARGGGKAVPKEREWNYGW